MATVTISGPVDNATVARHFSASGTYTPCTGGDPKPYVYLKLASGAFLASATVNGAGSSWTGLFSLTADYTNLKLVASIGVLTTKSEPITVYDEP